MSTKKTSLEESKKRYTEVELGIKTPLLQPWRSVLIWGILHGLLIAIVTLGVFVLLVALKIQGIIGYYSPYLFVESGFVFFIAGFVIFLAPSPSLAHAMSRILNRTIWANSTSQALRRGSRLMVTATTLLILSLI